MPNLPNVAAGQVIAASGWNDLVADLNNLTGTLTVDGGKVGIGTNTPNARLQVVGGAIMPEVGDSINAGIQFPLDAFGGNGDSASIRYYARSGEDTTLEIRNENDGADHIALMASGNVGIGTTAPSEKLDINGNTHVSGNTIIDGSLGIGKPSANAKIDINSFYAPSWTTNNWRKAIRTGDSGAIHFHSSSHFGIGIKTGKLHIFSSSSESVSATAINRLVIQNDGNVGIGTSIPNAKLEIANVASTDLRISNRGWNKAIKLNNTDVIVFDTGSNTQKYFIGATSNGERLYLGSITQDNDSTDPIYPMRIEADGEVVISDLNSSSDRRVKKSIKAFNGGLNIINRLNINQFEYNGLDDTPMGKTFVGLIAQEVEKVAPILISKSKRAFEEGGEDTSGLLRLRENQIKYIMINAIKELDEKLNDIHNHLQRLGNSNVSKTVMPNLLNTKNTKAEIQAFLQAQGIAYPTKATKVELLQIIKTTK